MSDIILEVSDLKKKFKTPRGMLHAVDGLTFSLERGKTLGIVGESGCGKSTAGRCILRLIEPTSGSVRFNGEEITALSKHEMRKRRKDMQIIFQDPFSSLDPRDTVAQIIAEGVRMNPGVHSRKEVEERVRELMDTVGLAERLYDSYPHELDGGRRQRIGIARALAVDPQLIVCDEPVSALDVSIQAQIINLLEELQEKKNLTYLFITHDLAVVNHISDEILVMYLGQVVEKAETEELFRNPVHPYTRALLSAIQIPRVGASQNRILLKGEISSPIEPPAECRFKKRCLECTEACCEGEPQLKEIAPGHWVRCFCV